MLVVSITVLIVAIMTMFDVHSWPLRKLGIADRDSSCEDDTYLSFSLVCRDVVIADWCFVLCVLVLVVAGGVGQI